MFEGVRDVDVDGRGVRGVDVDGPGVMSRTRSGRSTEFFEGFIDH